MAVAWAAAEGWNPGRHDADCYYAADPGGFFIGCLGSEPIATISAVKYGGRFGFLGFYIVVPEQRGKGYGLRIWNAGMAYLEGCDIGLDGVVAQQENYKRSGFALAYRNVRYEGRGGGTVPIGAGAPLVPLASLPEAVVRDYSRPFFPADRSAFLRAWLGQPEATALGLLEEGRLAGYGVIRRCRVGHKIGPLLADGPEQAERLFLALSAAVAAGEPLFLDVPEVNPAAVALAERHGMKVMFETARMYRGRAPELPLARQFGVTSFEIG